MENQEKLLQFVTWLGENVPELKGKAPEQIVETVNKLSSSEEGQQMLQELIKEFESNNTGIFKKGGKLNYLLCLKNGGSIQDCGCGKKIEKAQQGIPNLEYKESTKWVNDEVLPRIQHNLGRSRSVGNVSSKARLEFDYKDPGITLKQDGGRVLGSDQYPYATRRDALKAAMDEMGFSRAQARLAYKNQKKALRNAGFSGKEMLQNARYNVIDTAYPITQDSVPQPPILDTNFEIEDIPVKINDTFIPIENQPLNVEKIDKFGGNFNDAFAAARRSKLDSFVWDNPNAQYDRYSTQLGKTTPSAQQQEYEYNQQLVENSVNSPKLGDKIKSGILSTLNYPMK